MTNRQPAGVPTGGQFAPTSQSRPDVTLDDAPGPAQTGPRLSSEFTYLNDPASVRRAIAYGIEPRLAGHTRGGNEMFDQVLHIATRRAQQGNWNDAQAEIDSLDDGYTTPGTSQHGRITNARRALAEMRIEASRSGNPDVANAALSPLLARPYDRTAFQIKGGACYELRRLGPDEAADKGCPTATHAILGHHEERLGRVEPTTGRTSKVPGWSGRKGLRANFICDNDPDFEPLPGYVGQ